LAIKPTDIGPGKTVSGETRRFQAGHATAVFVGALLMTWPAIFNRYPLLYPDSMTYIGDGRVVARAVFLHKLSDYYGFRSFIYSLGIFPFHWLLSLWAVVALQALLASYVICLVVRSILPRQTVWCYLIICALLSLLTSMSWFASEVMPDILGPLLYLCIFLLVFARETLSRVERWAVILIAWWGVASHATHLILAAGMCIFLAFLWVLCRKSTIIRLRAVGEVALIVFFAAAAQVALHTYLYGEPSLNGERPPFLMARVIADGPGRWYLEQHCGEVRFAICDYVHNLPTDSDDFIWGENGVWQSASEETEKRMRQEEVPLVLATLRAYPGAQISKSLANFWAQLTTFGFELDANDWVLKEFDNVLPGGKPHYLQSRQARDAIPFDFLVVVQYCAVIASVVAIGVFGFLVWRRRSPRIVGLGLVILLAVVANAFVTGALSTVEDRYQSRVVWLIPFLACVLALNWREDKRPAEQ
jgi:nitrate reductase NapE component